MRRCSRHRLRIILAVILCLLFQQVAIAAYACSKPSMPAEPATMAEDCADMGMEAVRDVPALCAEHCAPDHAVLTDPSFAHVPALALPPLQFASALVRSSMHVALAGDVPVNRSDPPPRLRYCSLLI